MSPERNLDDALEIYRALILCRDEAMDCVRRDPGPFSRKFAEAVNAGRPLKGEPRNFFETFFDMRVTPTLYEVCFLDIVRIFEFMVFEMVKEASGNIKNIVRDPRSAKKTKFPFQSYADKFVKERGGDIHGPGDLRNLGDVKEILKGRLHQRLYDGLDAIVTYRNWLAHGNRFSGRPRHPGDLQDVVRLLNDILSEIKE
ncbi:MAG: hypothetical protein V2B18_05950 [Pseudomonadota bacterium]